MKIENLWRAACYRFFRLIWPMVSLLGTKAKFAFVYRMNLWGNRESVSGDGSTLEYTENIRKQLPLLFKEYGIKSIFDAPCGDYNWFRFVERNGVSYTGGDIVDALIKENQRKFADADARFIHFDICNSEFPQADLWLCRDCLFHLPEMDIMAAFENFAASQIPYVLTTSHHEAKGNVDLPRSGFRLLNLELPPYNLPRPVFAMDDWIPGFPPRILGLWRREDIRTAVQHWKLYSAGRTDG